MEERISTKYISDRIRKIVPARFWPGFGLCPNPGLADNFKPGGGGASVKAGSGE